MDGFADFSYETEMRIRYFCSSFDIQINSVVYIARIKLTFGDFTVSNLLSANCHAIYCDHWSCSPADGCWFVVMIAMCRFFVRRIVHVVVVNVLINICVGWHTITVTIVQRCIGHYCGILVLLSNCALNILRVLYGGCFPSKMNVKFVLALEFALLFCVFR